MTPTRMKKNTTTVKPPEVHTNEPGTIASLDLSMGRDIRLA
jgi:hypothetical protein